jgi:uncharacterized membrane protein
MKKYFMTGLMMLLPVIITFWIIFFLIRLFTAPALDLLEGLIQYSPYLTALFQKYPTLLRTAAHLLILACFALLLYLVGRYGRRYFVRAFLHAGGRTIQRLPFVGQLYGMSREVLQNLQATSTSSFHHVALLRFPQDQSWAVVLVAQDAPPPFPPNLVTVFPASTPNPTNGYPILVPRDQLTFVDMSVEEALRFVISLGVLRPLSSS